MCALSFVTLPVRGWKTVVLRLEPFYGKIDQAYLDFHLKHEWQEL